LVAVSRKGGRVDGVNVLRGFRVGSAGFVDGFVGSALIGAGSSEVSETISTPALFQMATRASRSRVSGNASSTHAEIKIGQQCVFVTAETGQLEQPPHGCAVARAGGGESAQHRRLNEMLGLTRWQSPHGSARATYR
jgi:hypothetical protein